MAKYVCRLTHYTRRATDVYTVAAIIGLDTTVAAYHRWWVTSVERVLAVNHRVLFYVSVSDV